MFIAWSKKDKRCLVSTDNPEYLSKYRQERDLYCPYTKCEVTYKKRGKDGRSPHFALLPTASMEDKERFKEIYNSKKGEGKVHLAVKHVLAEKIMNGVNRYELEKGDYQLFQEYPIKNQRADLALIDTDKQITVYEVQISPITLSELSRRTEYYLSNGVEKIWWLFRKEIVDEKTGDFKNYLRNMGCGFGIVTTSFEDKIVAL